jgi:flagellar basal-body rod protein FlgC
MSDIYEIAASGMSAQRTQMDVIAQNLANAGLPRADGSVFHAQTAVLQEASPFGSLFANALEQTGEDEFADISLDGDESREPAGVEVASIVNRNDGTQYRFDPGNPFAAHGGVHKGYVALPDVDPIEQMVALISAGRAYDANVSMLSAAKQMDMEAADIDRA